MTELTWLNELLAGNRIFTPQTIGYYWDGLVLTTQLVFLSLVAGLVLAIPLAIGRSSGRRWISLPIYVYTYVFRGTPLLIQLYIIYYGVVFFDGIQQTFLWPILRDSNRPEGFGQREAKPVSCDDGRGSETRKASKGSWLLLYRKKYC